jgi:rare lipoprotein A
MAGEQAARDHAPSPAADPALARLDWSGVLQSTDARGHTATPPTAVRGRDRPTASHALEGIASYYWQGTRTASGEPFDKRAMTAAHPSLPFGTQVRVTHAETGRTVVVRINDRGPFKPGRVIDLSEGAADVLGMRARGLVPVKLAVLAP